MLTVQLAKVLCGIQGQRNDTGRGGGTEEESNWVVSRIVTKNNERVNTSIMLSDSKRKQS